MYGHPFRFRGGHRPPPPQSANGPNPNNIFFQPPPPHSANIPNPNNAFFQPPPSFSLPNTARPFPFQNPLPFPPQNPSPPSPNPKHAIDNADRAAANACRDLLAAGDSVSAWKVSQSALLTLQVDSWNSLGIKMQQVPSLHRLMIAEGKVNAFVHCFVGVRRITSLYDLEVAICKNEGVDSFEALGLGPLLRHPLVIHYFSPRSDVTQVFKITSEEIIQLLSEFLDASKSNEFIKVELLLEFIAKKRLVKCKEWLGIRIQNLGMHISAIREARNSEQSTLEKCLKTLNLKNEKFRKRPLSSSQKKQLDDRFNAITQRVESFSSVKKSFCGKHIRFTSSSSEDEDSDSCTDDQNNNVIMGSQSKPTSQFTKSSERVSSCPYPSATEEMERLGVRSDMLGHSLVNSNLKNGFSEPPRKKRKSKNVTYTKSAPYNLRKRKKFEVDATPIKNGNTTKVSINMDEDLSMADDSLQMFVTTWKEACWEHEVTEVLERMLRFHRVNRCRWRKIRRMFSTYPFIGLLNAAVSFIKSGMRNNIYDTFQAIIDNEISNSPTKSSEFETIDVGPSLENVPVITKDSLENTKCISFDDVIRKIGTYFDLDNELNRNSNSLVQYRIMLLRKFCSCECWVAEQFGMKNFDSLGHGDFLSFLEKCFNQLPHELLKLLVGDTCKIPLLGPACPQIN
ncbi:hypothetical protein E2542_SST17079 [Spatholobus suberectus]|nr:hypothetical protein E2542_SST17079 [Spatholobus suberectus]